MLSEKDMEDAISENPDKYIEEGLKLVDRQYRIGKYVFDLIFEDRHGAKLIVELQKGTLDRTHTYKILDYYDEYKSRNPDQFVELMVIANKIPRERRDRLSSYGISFKEIPETEFPQSASSSDNEKEDKNVPISPVIDENVKWNSEAMIEVEIWLKNYLKEFSIGKTLDVGKVARKSREKAYIHPSGNADGLRHILGILDSQGYVKITDKKHFVILKKPE